MEFIFKYFYLSNKDKNICVICLQNTSNKISLWNCGHTCFHKNCAEQWQKHNNTCPYCRCSSNTDSELLDIEIEPDYDIPLINSFSQTQEPLQEETHEETHEETQEQDQYLSITLNELNYKFEKDINVNFELNLENYIYLWKTELCDHQYDNHYVYFNKPYGVLGFCSCGVIQSFNWNG